MSKVHPAILVAVIACTCLEPGVYPVSGRPRQDLELFRAEQEQILNEPRVLCALKRMI